MQALDFNYDSTYIQNTIQENEKPQTLESSDSSVSFMQMVKNEIQMKDASDAELVHTTDRDVLKSSNESAGPVAEEKYESAEKVAVSDKDVPKTEQTSEESKFEKKTDEKISLKDDKSETDKSEDTASLILRLVNGADKEIKKLSETKTFAAKKAFGIETEKTQANQKIAVLKEHVDDEKLKALLVNAKESKTDKDDLVEAAIFASVEVKQADTQNIKDLFTKNTAENNPRDLKVKKSDKKLTDVISVTDLRTQKPEAQISEKKTQMVTSIKQTSSDSVAVTMDLNAQAQKNILSLDAQTAGAQGSTFQAMLENQITENAADFVKAGNIILKDNNVGQINLILHPESLGNVKMSLELSDKGITGKILVASQEAYDAFVKTQDSLKAAFIESGFDTASFDVAFAGQGQNFSDSGSREQQNTRQAQKYYDEFVSENISVAENNSDSYNDVRDYSISIVA